MRLNAIIAATVTSAAVFAVLGSTPVHAEEPQTQNETKTQQQAEEKKKVENKIVEVKPGDFLEKIAKENNTTYPRLYDANTQIKDPNIIYPGDKLRVPNPDEKLKSRTVQTVAATPAPTRKYSSTTYSAPQQVAAPAVAVNGDVWDRLAQCESGGNWAINTGNGYYGGLQFSLGSWRGVGGVGYPHQASRDEQIARGKMLQARQGWGAWPSCTLKLGIR